jgi:hypothetical protein
MLNISYFQNRPWRQFSYNIILIFKTKVQDAKMFESRA